MQTPDDTTEAQPSTTDEIEIYLRSDPTPILGWLAKRFHGSAALVVRARGGLVTRTGHVHFTASEGVASRCAVLFVEAVADGFSSLSFTGADLPWASDLECGREAAAALGCPVRCNSEAWQPGDDEEDGWLELTRDGERALRWRSG